MYSSYVRISGISFSNNADHSEDGVNINQETRHQKVNSNGSATVSESKLLNGLKARENIVIKNKSEIQGETESTTGGITAEDTTFQDVKAREKIKMTNCKARDVTVSMDGLIADNTQFHRITTREKINMTNCKAEDVTVSMDGCRAENSSINYLNVREKAVLTNCIVSNYVKVRMDGLNWNNDISYKDQFQCETIEAREKIDLTNVCVSSVKSFMDKVIGINCILKVVEAREGVELIDTSAQMVEVSMGTLQVISQNAKIVLEPYQSLKAREDIWLANIEAISVTSEMGSITAQNCILGSVKGNQTLGIQKSIVKQSINLNIDPSKSCKLLLNDTIVNGDLIIDACNGGSIDISTSSIGIKIGHVSVADVSIQTGGTYNSISDIPSKVKSMVLMTAKEGQKVIVGNLECVIKNGALELPQKTPLTLEKLQEQISLIIGPKATCARLEFNGGVYRITKGKVEIIQAPPGLVMPSRLGFPPTTQSLQPVTIEIVGGKINGKVIFKNCQGTVKLLDGAIVEG